MSGMLIAARPPRGTVPYSGEDDVATKKLDEEGISQDGEEVAQPGPPGQPPPAIAEVFSGLAIGELVFSFPRRARAWCLDQL